MMLAQAVTEYILTGDDDYGGSFAGIIVLGFATAFLVYSTGYLSSLFRKSASW